MENNNNVKIVSPGDYHLYNLVIERLSKVIPELRYAIANCKDLEENGFDMDFFRLQEAMIDILLPRLIEITRSSFTVELILSNTFIFGTPLSQIINIIIAHLYQNVK